jgi:hypothetical protein
MGVDVRRLAAVDMYGLGTPLRRRVILVEFVLGATVGVALGVLAILIAPGPRGWLFGVWLTGVCLNYVPLAIHAARLHRPGVLEAELAGVDIPRELRHYTVVQLWILVPLLMVVLDLIQRRRRT